MPTSVKACLSLAYVYKCFEIIKASNPKYWYIENPMGYLRKFPIMQKQHRVTTWYCQYGDTRMKPTDIWTNCSFWNPKQMCKNGDSCHTPAPRGSKTGTQGLKGNMERSVVPEKLCLEILEVCEQNANSP